MPSGMGPDDGPNIGFQLPDLVVLERLRAGWRAVQMNPDQIDDVLMRFDEEYQRQFKDLLTRGADVGRFIPLYSGWPVETGHIPGIGVTSRPESEDQSRQIIGEVGSFVEEGSGARTAVYGTYQRISVEIACYGTSQRGAQLLAQVSKWILFQCRSLLDNDGLLEQVVSLADVEPIQEEWSTDWFMVCMVRLSCTYMDSWTELSGPLISDAEVSVYAESSAAEFAL